MTRGMVPVELVEGDGPDDDGSPTHGAHSRLADTTTSAARAAAALWRRPALRAVALGAVAVVVVGLAAQAADQRTRLAAVAAVPGTVLPLGPEPRTVYRIEGPDADAAASGVAVDGVVVGPSAAPDAGVVGLDADTGAALWRTELPAGGQSRMGAALGGPHCAAASGTVVCVSQVADAEHSARGIYWVIDPATGAVMRTETLGEHGWAEVVGGLLLVAEQVEGPRRAPAGAPWTVRWRVTGQDATSGAVAWTWTSPPVTVHAENLAFDDTHDPADYVSWTVRLDSSWPHPGDDLVLMVGDTMWVLHADGTLRAALDRGWDPWTTASGTLLRSRWSETGERVELLAADGSWRRLEGARPWLSLDDGSAPGLVLLTGNEPGDAPLTGIDAATGDVLWQLPAKAGGDPWLDGGLLFEGTVYAGHGNVLQAVDAATGELRWSVPGPAWPTTTDGEVLLAEGGGAVATLTAYSLADGHVVWSAGQRDLAGRDDDGRVRVVQGVTVLSPLRRVAAVWEDSTMLVLG